MSIERLSFVMMSTASQKKFRKPQARTKVVLATTSTSDHSMMAKAVIWIAARTDLIMSFAQTLMHYKLGHRPMGGKFFRNHINFHHTYYSKDHLVSRTYLGDQGCSTLFVVVHIAQEFEAAERGGVAILRDGIGLIEP